MPVAERTHLSLLKKKGARAYYDILSLFVTIMLDHWIIIEIIVNRLFYAYSISTNYIYIKNIYITYYYIIHELQKYDLKLLYNKKEYSITVTLQ